MKDEKPEVGETIIFYIHPNSWVSCADYMGQLPNEQCCLVVRPKVAGLTNSTLLYNDNVLWRKMCKLPGEK